MGLCVLGTQTQRLFINKKETEMQRNSKRFITAIAALASVFAISACTPPMPPELEAQLADQYVTCEAGEFNLTSPAELTTMSSWIAEYNAVCGAEGVLVDQVADPTVTVDAYLTTDTITPAPCQVIRAVPIALDGAVPVISITDLDSAILSPKVLFDIFDGAITTWDDPAIAEINPDSQLPSTPIVVDTKVLPEILQSFATWMNILEAKSWATTPKLLTADSTAMATTTILTAPINGTIGLYSYSFAANNSLGLVSIQGAQVIDPTMESLASGATQMRYLDAPNLGVPLYDPNIPAVALQGDDEATTPWGAFIPTMMNICATDHSTTSRAFARFISRLDAQGNLVDLNLTSLGETIRSQSIVDLAIGLSSPIPIPSDVVVPEEPVATDEATPEPSAS